MHHSFISIPIFYRNLIIFRYLIWVSSFRWYQIEIPCLTLSYCSNIQTKPIFCLNNLPHLVMTSSSRFLIRYPNLPFVPLKTSFFCPFNPILNLSFTCLLRILPLSACSFDLLLHFHFFFIILANHFSRYHHRSTYSVIDISTNSSPKYSQVGCMVLC